MSNDKISPRKPGGFNDYAPDLMIARQAILDTIRRVYERHGFLPLETSAVEYRQVLTGGKPTDMQIFAIKGKVDGDESEKALRFDLTVPLARFVAANWELLPRPFKRYQLGSVWRGEKPQAGRFNEFSQFDIDIVGSSSLLADAETISVMHSVMTELGVTRFQIRVNSRKILDALAEYAGLAEEEASQVFRELDKIDKVGVPEVMRSLADSVGLSASACEKVERLLGACGSGNAETLDRMRELLADIAVGREGIEDIETVLAYARTLGLDRIVVDPSVVRGLSYYTGLVFETVLDDLPGVGSVFSGGRYDGLVSRFSDLNVAAVGASIGVDRFVDAMERLGRLSRRKTLTQALIVRFSPSLDDVYLRLAKRLRASGVRTEVYLGDESAFKAQLAYAATQEIPVVLIVGPDELSAGQVTVKDMRLRTQARVPEGSVVENILEILAETPGVAASV